MKKITALAFVVAALATSIVVSGCGEKSEPPLTTNSLPENQKTDSNATGDVSPNIPKAPDRGRK